MSEERKDTSLSRQTIETTGRGDPKAPGELRGLDLEAVARQEKLPGSELNASTLGAYVQSVAEEAARTGRVSTPDDWFRAIRRINMNSFGMLANNPEQNAVVRFQRIFLSGLTGKEDATMQVIDDSDFAGNK